MKLLGVVMAYNEADCIGNAIECLANSGHDVFVFNHGSTDKTKKVVRAAGVKHVGVDRRIVPFLKIFPHICRWIHKRQSDFDWVTWIAADELLQPRPDQALRVKDIEKIASQGFGVIRPLLREFWMTDADPTASVMPDYIDRLRYYRDRPIPNCPRGWRIELTGLMPHGLHRPNNQWRGRPKIHDRKWTLAHYPIRTMSQARQKIMRERLPQTAHYQPYRRKNCANIVKLSSSLKHAGVRRA